MQQSRIPPACRKQSPKLCSTSSRKGSHSIAVCDATANGNASRLVHGEHVHAYAQHWVLLKSNGNRVALKRHFSDEVSTQVGEPWNGLLAMLSDETLRRRHPESKTYFPLGGLLVTADR